MAKKGTITKGSKNPFFVSEEIGTDAQVYVENASKVVALTGDATADTTVTLTNAMANASLKTVAAGGSMNQESVVLKKNTVTLDGISVKEVYGGALATDAKGNIAKKMGSSISVDAVELTLVNGKYTNVYGGGAGYGSSTGNVVLNVNGGSINTIYGGGAKGAVVNGNVDIFISGANLYSTDYRISNIYAGGNDAKVYGDVKVTFGSSAKNLKFSGTVSGLGKGKNSYVGGSTTLVFQDYAGDFNATIKSFDTVQFIGGASVTLKKSQDKSMKNATYEFVLNNDSIALQDAMLTLTKKATLKSIVVKLDSANVEKLMTGENTITLISSKYFKKEADFNAASVKFVDETGAEISDYAYDIVYDYSKKGGTVSITYKGSVLSLSDTYDQVLTLTDKKEVLNVTRDAKINNGIYTLGGNDIVNLQTGAVVNSDIDLGTGDNELNIAKEATMNGNIRLSENSNNEISITGRLSGDIKSSGSASNVITLNSAEIGYDYADPTDTGALNSTSTSSDGKISTQEYWDAKFEAKALVLGDSNDTVKLYGKTKVGDIDLGAGDDTLVLNNQSANTNFTSDIIMGSGSDTLVINDENGLDYTKADGTKGTRRVIFNNEAAGLDKVVAATNMTLNFNAFQLGSSKTQLVLADGVEVTGTGASVGNFLGDDVKWGVELGQNAQLNVGNDKLISNYSGSLTLDNKTLHVINAGTGNGITYSELIGGTVIFEKDSKTDEGTVVKGAQVTLHSAAVNAIFENSNVTVNANEVASAGDIVNAAATTIGTDAQLKLTKLDAVVLGNVTKDTDLTGVAKNVVLNGTVKAALTLKDQTVLMNQYNVADLKLSGANTVIIGADDAELADRGLNASSATAIFDLNKITFTDAEDGTKATLKFQVKNDSRLAFDGAVTEAMSDLQDRLSFDIGKNAGVVLGDTVQTGSWDKKLDLATLFAAIAPQSGSVITPKNVIVQSGSSLVGGMVDTAADSQITIQDDVTVYGTNEKYDYATLDFTKGGKDVINIGKATVYGTIDTNDQAADELILNGTKVYDTVNEDTDAAFAVTADALDTVILNEAQIAGTVNGAKYLNINNSTITTLRGNAEHTLATDTNVIGTLDMSEKVTGASVTDFSVLSGTTTIAAIDSGAEQTDYDSKAGVFYQETSTKSATFNVEENAVLNADAATIFANGLNLNISNGGKANFALGEAEALRLAGTSEIMLTNADFAVENGKALVQNGFATQSHDEVDESQFGIATTYTAKGNATVTLRGASNITASEIKQSQATNTVQFKDSDRYSFLAHQNWATGTVNANIIQTAAVDTDGRGTETQQAGVANIVNAGLYITHEYDAYTKDDGTDYTVPFAEALPAINTGDVTRVINGTVTQVGDTNGVAIGADVTADGKYDNDAALVNSDLHKAAEVNIGKFESSVGDIAQTATNQNAVMVGFMVEADGESDVTVASANVTAGNITQVSKSETDVTPYTNDLLIGVSLSAEEQAELTVNGDVKVSAKALKQVAYKGKNRMQLTAGESSEADEKDPVTGVAYGKIYRDAALALSVTVASIDMAAYGASAANYLNLSGNVTVEKDITVGGVLAAENDSYDEISWGDRTALTNTVNIAVDTVKVGGKLQMIGRTNRLYLTNNSVAAETISVDNEINMCGNDNQVDLGINVVVTNIHFYQLKDYDHIGEEGYELGTGTYTNTVIVRGTVDNIDVQQDNSNDNVYVYGGLVTGDVTTKNGNDTVSVGWDDSVQAVRGDSEVAGNVVMGIKDAASGTNAVNVDAFVVTADNVTTAYNAKIGGNVEMYSGAVYDDKGIRTASAQNTLRVSGIARANAADGQLVTGKASIGGSVTMDAVSFDKDGVVEPYSINYAYLGALTEVGGNVTMKAINDNSLYVVSSEEVVADGNVIGYADIKGAVAMSANSNSISVQGVNDGAVVIPGGAAYMNGITMDQYYTDQNGDKYLTNVTGYDRTNTITVGSAVNYNGAELIVGSSVAAPADLTMGTVAYTKPGDAQANWNYDSTTIAERGHDIIKVLDEQADAVLGYTTSNTISVTGRFTAKDVKMVAEGNSVAVAGDGVLNKYAAAGTTPTAEEMSKVADEVKTASFKAASLSQTAAQDNNAFAASGSGMVDHYEAKVAADGTKTYVVTKRLAGTRVTIDDVAQLALENNNSFMAAGDIVAKIGKTSQAASGDNQIAIDGFLSGNTEERRDLETVIEHSSIDDITQAAGRVATETETAKSGRNSVSLTLADAKNIAQNGGKDHAAVTRNSVYACGEEYATHYVAQTDLTLDPAAPGYQTDGTYNKVEASKIDGAITQEDANVNTITLANASLTGAATQSAKETNTFMAVATSTDAAMTSTIPAAGADCDRSATDHEDAEGKAIVVDHTAEAIVSQAAFNTQSTGNISQVIATSDSTATKGNTVVLKNVNAGNIDQTNAYGANTVRVSAADKLTKYEAYRGEIDITAQHAGISKVGRYEALENVKAGNVAQTGLYNTATFNNGVDAGAVNQTSNYDAEANNAQWNSIQIENVQATAKAVYEEASWDVDHEVFTKIALGENAVSRSTFGALKQTTDAAGNYGNGTKGFTNRIDLTVATVDGTVDQLAEGVDAYAGNSLQLRSYITNFKEVATTKVDPKKVETEWITYATSEIKGNVTQVAFVNTVSVSNGSDITGAVTQTANSVKLYDEHEVQTGAVTQNNTFTGSGISYATPDSLTEYTGVNKDVLDYTIVGSISQTLNNNVGDKFLNGNEGSNSATLTDAKIVGAVTQTAYNGTNTFSLGTAYAALEPKEITVGDVTQDGYQNRIELSYANAGAISQTAQLQKSWDTAKQEVAYANGSNRIEATDSTIASIITVDMADQDKSLVGSSTVVLTRSTSGSITTGVGADIITLNAVKLEGTVDGGNGTDQIAIYDVGEKKSDFTKATIKLGTKDTLLNYAETRFSKIDAEGDKITIAKALKADTIEWNQLTKDDTFYFSATDTVNTLDLTGFAGDTNDKDVIASGDAKFTNVKLSGGVDLQFNSASALATEGTVNFVDGSLAGVDLASWDAGKGTVQYNGTTVTYKADGSHAAGWYDSNDKMKISWVSGVASTKLS